MSLIGLIALKKELRMGEAIEDDQFFRLEGNLIASMGLCYRSWPKAKPTSSHPQDRSQLRLLAPSFFQMT